MWSYAKKKAKSVCFVLGNCEMYENKGQAAAKLASQGERQGRAVLCPVSPRGTTSHFLGDSLHVNNNTETKWLLPRPRLCGEASRTIPHQTTCSHFVFCVTRHRICGVTDHWHIPECAQSTEKILLTSFIYKIIHCLWGVFLFFVVV